MTIMNNGQVLRRVYSSKTSEDVSALVADIAIQINSPEAKILMAARGVNPENVETSASAVRMGIVATIVRDVETPFVERFAAISAFLPVNGSVNEQG